MLMMMVIVIVIIIMILLPQIIGPCQTQALFVDRSFPHATQLACRTISNSMVYKFHSITTVHFLIK
jgi:hypothetical protein